MDLTHKVERQMIEVEGMVAVLFLPEQIHFPLSGIITLGGGSGGLNECRARLLASYGFAVLSLAYFGIGGLPDRLEEIPLEYFEKAIDWFLRRPFVKAHRIALWGVSRGAELSLLLGTLFPKKINAIAACSPSSVIYGALIDPNKPAWTYRGLPLLPNAPFPVGSHDFKMEKKAIALTPFFLKGMKDLYRFDASAIPVEKLESPLLLISGEDDQMWPSSLFSFQIQQRLKHHRSAISCFHYSYPGAGHSIAPFCHPVNIGRIHSVDELWFDFGGNPIDDAKASKDGWEKTLHFFKTQLYTQVNSKFG